MKAIFTDDPGKPDKRYTVCGNEGLCLGSFDTQEEVLEVIVHRPDGECTIRFGRSVTWDGPEAGDLAKKISEASVIT